MKNNAKEKSSVRRTKQNKVMLLLVSNCAVSGKKKLRLIKIQKSSRLELHESVFDTPCSSAPVTIKFWAGD